MEKDNILLLITPKTSLICLDDHMSVRQGLEKMRAHSYTAIPVIDEKNGVYLGSISEGDFLNIILKENTDLKKLEGINIKDIIREDFMPAITIGASYDDLMNIIVSQNFVPIIDDRKVLMGIVTRKSVMSMLKNKLNSIN